MAGVDGLPQPWFVMVHREQFSIDFTWDVMAMRATGSHGVAIENAFIADDLAGPLTGPPMIDRALYRGYLPSIVFLGARPCCSVSPPRLWTTSSRR